ncbi:MAG: class I SAM-dependent methyltransferase [Bacillota bacterium]|uniref:Methyltransferase domain-containing protein n=1 Tax=Thermanaerosceptrum fracticalcis TaxID=1712410 RepID=A0A7G6E2Z3_THEFR|nr:class I SAM-dependent methyltransferase [Thermanaerosceptrum fracticalcis]QNB46447.1 methyltransferase domain-containing protein [Thermanaerosceptrum fracticalcis]
MTVELNRSFFNNKADQWDNIVNHNPERIQYLLGKLCLIPGASVLDVGTGTGILLPFLLKLVGETGRITAIDVAEKMIEKAKAKFPHPNIQFIAGDVTDASFPPQSFDAIVCYSVFPHFINPWETLQSMNRYLKDGGLLLICHSESRETINQRHKELGRSLISHGLPPAEDLEALLTEVGFKVIDKKDNEYLYFVLGKK